MPEPNVRQKLKETFQNQPASTHTKHWNELWQQNLTPWDRNGPSLALRDAITNNPSIFGTPFKSPDNNNAKRKRALIPGCGRGYDVLLLSSLGYEAYGLDASATAIEAARKLQQQLEQQNSSGQNGEEKDERYAPVPSGKGEATFVNADFFSFSSRDIFPSAAPADAEGEEQMNFDLIFDYTFLCALPPELRPRWAARQTQLLAKDGRMVCLEWPLGKDPKEGGPPFGLSSGLYLELLKRPGEEVGYDDRGRVVERKSDGGSAGEGGGLVRMVHFRPGRTHEAGVESDYVSVWKHA